MSKHDIKKTFDKIAKEYEEMIAKVIPYYYEQHEVMCSFIPFPQKKNIRILDVGIGTGTISKILLERYLNSTVHGVDISEKMIKVCREDLKKYSKRLTISCGAIEKIDPSNKYDLVVAGLSIHHLTNSAKSKFFKNIWKSLNKGGVLLIRDIVRSKSVKINKIYRNLWIDFMNKNNIKPNKITKNSKDNDITTTVENHMTWLKEAGFRDVDCVWKYNNVAIIVAYK